MLAALALAAWLAVCAAPAGSFHFVLLGDRTGRSAAGSLRAHLAGTGRGAAGVCACRWATPYKVSNDATAEAEWREVRRIARTVPARFRCIWRPAITISGREASERLFRQYAERPPHYSFDSGGAHFTVLDNSRSDAWPAGELAWLEADLRAHAAAPVKFVVSHRPSWLLDAALGNTNGPLHAHRQALRRVLRDGGARASVDPRRPGWRHATSRCPARAGICG